VTGQLIYCGTAVLYLLNTKKEMQTTTCSGCNRHTKSNDWCRRATGLWVIAFPKFVMVRVREAIQGIIA